MILVPSPHGIPVFFRPKNEFRKLPSTPLYGKKWNSPLTRCEQQISWKFWTKRWVLAAVVMTKIVYEYSQWVCEWFLPWQEIRLKGNSYHKYIEGGITLLCGGSPTTRVETNEGRAKPREKTTICWIVVIYIINLACIMMDVSHSNVCALAHIDFCPIELFLFKRQILQDTFMMHFRYKLWQWNIFFFIFQDSSFHFHLMLLMVPLSTCCYFWCIDERLMIHSFDVGLPVLTPYAMFLHRMLSDTITDT